MTVSIDGPTLSRLLFSYLNNIGNQYGLLLGDKIDQVKSRVSDSQMHTSDVNSIFCVSSFLPWPSNEPMFSRSGCINEECLQQLISATEQRIVGWYSFRHQSVLRPSLREITLHNGLSSSGKFDGSTHDFLFFLCTSSSSSNMSTFTCNHVVMQLKQGNFKAVPITILNLGDTTRKEYRKESNATLSHCGAVTETFERARKRFIHSSGQMDQVIRVSTLASSLNKNLETLQSKVIQSEGILGLLEADVETLRDCLKRMEQEEVRELLASNADRRQKEQQQGRAEDDEAAEAEERAQMEKLLRDLGLADANGESASAEGASEVATNNVPDMSSVSMEIEPACDKIYSSLEDASDRKVAILESDESNESDSDELLSVKKIDGQKTYFHKKESDKLVKADDPFDFLATENEKEKEKLMKCNKPMTNTEAKVNSSSKEKSAIRFAEFSNSTEKNGHVNNFKTGEMSNGNNDDMNSSDEDAVVSSTRNASSANKGIGDEINESYFHNDTYTISSSPSF